MAVRLKVTAARHIATVEVSTNGIAPPIRTQFVILTLKF
jgi:hypothetical protein